MVEFYGYFIDNEDKLNLVLEHAEGEVLNNLISDECLNHNHKMQLIKQIADMLLYLKNHRTLHRDLKPDNFIVQVIDSENIKIKILDFGISKVSDISIFSLSNTSISIQYCPPEIFIIDEKGSYKLDIWSFGIIVAYVFSEQLPWGKLNNLQIEYKLCHKQNYPIPKVIEDPNIRKLIELCTKVNPKERLAPEGILKLIDKINNKENISNLTLDDSYFK